MCIRDSYSGAESVVAVTLAQFGEQVSFASKLSSNRLGTNAIMNLARYGVDTSRITRSNHRMGLYYTCLLYTSRRGQSRWRTSCGGPPPGWGRPRFRR